MSRVTNRDPVSDLLGRLIETAVRGCILLLGLPLVIPALAGRLFGNFAATKTRFWVVWKWH